ncbi:hypothetical protein RJ640_000399 [Escallonia rubra]|uniref:RNase H type-1 domain-containing protein n=1 Tax=Escallonia rubra TaxID=112253 RepID=A0AA88UN70_9ASTE|nr:hypothetical protein RJ640_000399 [Escallonia rubra]
MVELHSPMALGVIAHVDEAVAVHCENTAALDFNTPSLLISSTKLGTTRCCNCCWAIIVDNLDNSSQIAVEHVQKIAGECGPNLSFLQIFGDSQLVIKQMNGEFKCSALDLEMYYNIASYLLIKFDDVTITHVPRIDNGSANVMAQLASGLRVPDKINDQWVKVSKQLPLISDRYG